MSVLRKEAAGCRTLFELAEQQAARLEDQVAFRLLDGDRQAVDSLTFAGLAADARRLAGLLQAYGAAGERALLLFPHGLDFIRAFFGCIYAHAVGVPLCPPHNRKGLPRILPICLDAAPRFVLTNRQMRDWLAPFVADAPEFQDLEWILVDEAGNASGDWTAPKLEADSLAFLQYTSGSTAAPKGVMVSHGNIMANEHMIRRAFGHTQGGDYVSWTPYFHDMGLIGGILQPLLIGGTSNLLAPAAFLQRPVRWLRAISDVRAESSGGPNFAYDHCVRRIKPEQCEGLDLSCWRLAFNGAEPIHHETLDRFAARFTPYGFRREAFYPCYGLAEATLFVTGGLRGQAARQRRVAADDLGRNRVRGSANGAQGARTLVSSGRPWLECEVRIVDPESRLACAQSTVGEVWVRGPNVALGYWNNPAETERTMHARLADSGEGPFLRTGDLGFLSDGELYVTGRIKDLIILDGVNHYPQDIEQTVGQSFPAFQAHGGAAFSVELEGRERLVVVQEVERTWLQRLDMEAAVQSVRSSISAVHDQRVYDVVLVKPGSIPKTSSGKLQRHACRQGYLAGKLEPIAPER